MTISYHLEVDANILHIFKPMNLLLYKNVFKLLQFVFNLLKYYYQ